LIYRLLREDQMCPIVGGEHGPRDCPQATNVHCAECGYRWECDDTGPANTPIYKYAGECEQCESTAIVLDRCAECPILELEWQRQNSAVGRWLEHLLLLDFEVKHFPTAQVITVEDATGLRILDQERNKYQIEKQKSDIEKMEEQRRVKQQMQRRSAEAF